MGRVDDLIEKCKLTDEDIRNLWDDYPFFESPHSYSDRLCEAQLRKAIPIIQKAERERLT